RSGPHHRPRDTPGIAGELNNVPGDRRISAERGGEGMSRKNKMTSPSQAEVSEQEILQFEDSIDRDDFGSAPRKAKAFWPSAVRMLGLLANRKLALAVVFLLVIASVVLTVYAPRVLGQAMDIIFSGAVSGRMPEGLSREQVIAGAQAEGNTELADMLSGMEFTPGEGIEFGALGQLLIIVLLMYCAAALFMWLQGLIMNALTMRVIYQLRRDIERKINRLPLNYFDTRQRGDILSRTTNDVDNIQQALQQAVSQLIQSILLVLGVTVMMFALSWQLALIALVALPISAIAIGIIGTKSQALFASQWRATGRLNGHIEESFTGHDLVRAFGRSEDMQAEFHTRNEELYEAASKAQFYSSTMMPIMNWVTYLSYVGIAVVGGLRGASGQMSLGAVTAAIQYSREFNQPLTEMAGMMNQLQSGVASAERVFELLDAEEEVEDRSAPADASDASPAEPAVAASGAKTNARTEEPDATLPRTTGAVEFRGVDFSYSPEVPLIRDMNLAVRPGQTVAIVGPTGAGKTTLVNLIMRFYDIDAGQITLDGVDIHDLGRAELRSRVGMVLQDAVLFEGTIMENIRYGRLDATDEEVIAAAKATYVDRFVRALPEGYETVISQDSGAISVGERQLITIARAFLSAPELLILDEATSSVDTRTELLIQQAMAALQSERTSFVIAHRLSTIRDADVIVVMKDGAIAEQGTHAELLAAGG